MSPLAEHSLADVGVIKEELLVGVEMGELQQNMLV